MSCDISATPWTKCENASTGGWWAKIDALLRARSTRCYLSEKIAAPKERCSLRLLLKANKRLNTAYMLKETFGQLWDYQTEGWARRFFENWRDSLKWQRLKPYEKFAGDDRESLGRYRSLL